MEHTPTAGAGRRALRIGSQTVAAATAGLFLGLAGCSGDEPSAGSTAPADSSATAPATGAGSSTPAGTPGAGQASGRATGASHSGEAQTPAANTSPVVSTPVQAPSKGNIRATVAPASVASAAPVRIGKNSTVSDGVTVTIADVRATTTKATVPGDVAGPGIVFTVTVQNDSQQPVDAADAVVTVTASDNSPAVMSMGEPTRMFDAPVAPGSSASASYAFRVAKDKRNPVTITVSVDPSVKVATFTGNAA